MTANIKRKPIEAKMSVQQPSLGQVEQKLLMKFRTSTAGFQEEAASQGEVFIDGFTPGSIVLQLRPITDQAAQNLLNAKENNKLFQMILGILKQINISELFNGSETLEINLQVCYARKSNQGNIIHLFLILLLCSIIVHFTYVHT